LRHSLVALSRCTYKGFTDMTHSEFLDVSVDPSFF
jgi:hypothetical protein